jgi:hypothetical protein
VGVGSTVIKRAAAHLEGAITQTWGGGGLIFELSLPLGNLEGAPAG